MTSPLRIIFAGTPEFSVSALSALASEHQVVAVLSQPDRPAGRGRQLRASPVKEFAVAQGLPVLQPDSLKSESIQQQLKDLDADCMVVVAYGLILPQQVLDIPRHGCLNIHASLLPRWRGAAPIQRAIAAGDTKSGVTIMQMDKGLDTGDMLAIESCDIEATDTGSSLHDKLAAIGARLLLKVLEQMQQSQLKPQAQDNSLACYAEKLNKSEALIDWTNDAILVERLIRAFNAWPVAHTLHQGKILRIWQASTSPVEISDMNQYQPGQIIETGSNGILVACGNGVLSLERVQLAGKKQASAQEFSNGRNLVGEVLGIEK